MGILGRLLGSSSGSDDTVNPNNPDANTSTNRTIIDKQEVLEGHIESVVEFLGRSDDDFEPKVRSAESVRGIKEVASEYRNKVLGKASTKVSQIEDEREELDQKVEYATENQDMYTEAIRKARSREPVLDDFVDELEQELEQMKEKLSKVVSHAESGELDHAKGAFYTLLEDDEERKKKFEAKLEEFNRTT